MRKLLYIFSMSALATTLALPAAAQEKRPGKLGEYDEIIIKRKNGEKNAKVTIEIKDGEVWADGRKLDEYNDGNIVIQRRRIMPRNGNADMGGMNGMPFFNNDEEGMMTITPNKAVLGVMTEKKEAAGATVVEVSEGSPAGKAGLKKGDVITGVNNKKISEPQDLYETIGGMEPGEKVSVTYQRNGKEHKVSATLDKRADNVPRMFNFPPNPAPGNQFRFRGDMPPFGGFGPGFRNGGARLGLSVQDTEDGNGARVLGITKGSAAEKAGFATDDLVTEIAGQPVKNAAEVAEAYRNHKNDGSITAKVQRNGKTETLTIKVPKKLNTENL